MSRIMVFDTIDKLYGIISGVDLIGPPVPVYKKRPASTKECETAEDMLLREASTNDIYSEMVKDAMARTGIKDDSGVGTVILSPLAVKKSVSLSGIEYIIREQAVQLTRRHNRGGFSVSYAEPLKYDSNKEILTSFKRPDNNGLVGVALFSKPANLQKYYPSPTMMRDDLEISKGIGQEVFNALFRDEVVEKASKIEAIKNLEVKSILPSRLMPVAVTVETEDKGKISDPHGKVYLAASYLI